MYDTDISNFCISVQNMYHYPMNFTNAQVSAELRKVAAALTIKGGNFFQVRAYEGAADAIEHASQQVKQLWEVDKLDEIPGIGESLKGHLNEFFKTGKVKHWEQIKAKVPKAVFEFLDIPGIGPKTALKLTGLGVTNTDDLITKLELGSLVEKGLSQKMAGKILAGLKEKAALQTRRVLLPMAFNESEAVLEYLKHSKFIQKMDVLGSLRRMVATIGDLDFAIGSDTPGQALSYIEKYPGIVQVLEKGEAKLTAVLHSGLHMDFLVVEPNTYGALLQHFTGSKHHNIHLRTIAETKGYSLSEYGVKVKESGRILPIKKEDEIYKLLGMQTPPPELREDTGEIEAGQAHKLPDLVESKDIKGDFHLHSSYQIEPSHDLGVNSLEEMVKYAEELGYEYIGSSDHQPGVSNHSQEQVLNILVKRREYIEKINYSSKNVRVLNLLEVDILPDGNLGVPESASEFVDFYIIGVHSSHRQDKEQMTKRILTALKHPKAKILAHPTGRLLNERSSYEADWEEIFKIAAKTFIAMEINAYPNRLDLPDNLVRMAKDLGVRFVLDTDSHELSQMDNMKFGVAMARRGWLTKQDVINSWEWAKVAKWFKLV